MVEGMVRVVDVESGPDWTGGETQLLGVEICAVSQR